MSSAASFTLDLSALTLASRPASTSPAQLSQLPSHRRLPVELDLRIISFLALSSLLRPAHSLSQDLLSCSLVCHDWHEFALSLLFKSVVLDSKERLRSFAACEMRKKYTTEGITLKDVRGQSSQFVKLILKQNPGLKALQVESTVWPWSRVKKKRPPPLADLYYLYVGSGVSIDRNFDLSILFPRLQHLYIGGKALSLVQDSTVRTHCSSLLHLELDTPCREDFESDLDFSGAYSIFRREPFLSTLTTLTFHINSFQHPEPWTLHIISQCTSLRHLSFSFGAEVTDVQSVGVLVDTLVRAPPTLHCLTFLNSHSPSAQLLAMLKDIIGSRNKPPTPVSMRIPSAENLKVVEFGCRRGDLMRDKNGQQLLEVLEKEEIGLNFADGV